MILKLCFSYIFIVLVSSLDAHFNDTLIMKINNEEVRGQVVLNNGLHLKKTKYDFYEYEKLNISCEAVNIPGRYYNMILMINSDIMIDLCIEASPNSKIDIQVSPVQSYAYKCQVTAASDDKCLEADVKRYVFVLQMGKSMSRPKDHDTKVTDGQKKQDIKDLKISKNQNVPVIKVNSVHMSGKDLKITGLNEVNVISRTDDYIKYKYVEGETLSLSCSLPTNSLRNIPKFEMNWNIHGETIGRKDDNYRTSLNVTMDAGDRNTEIVCTATEAVQDNTRIKMVKTIKIIDEEAIVFKDNDVVDSVTERNSDKNEAEKKRDAPAESEQLFIMYIIVALISFVLLIVIVILIAMNCRRKKNSENNTVVQWNAAIEAHEVLTEDAYSNPTDAYYATTTMPATYSVPYTVLYTTPIPKKLRVVKNYANNDYCIVEKKIEYENLDKRLIGKSDSLQNFEGKYVNLDSENIDLYSNTLSAGGTDMHRYSIVRK